MKQSTLFDQFDQQQRTRQDRSPNAYKQTSRDALASFQADGSATLDEQILSVLLAAGKAGLIDQEIESRLGRSHQAVSGNRRHLVERELVCETVLRGKTSSGRNAIRWVHADCYDAAIHKRG
jgi:hypothetical protein